jgi:hypothetical protein
MPILEFDLHRVVEWAEAQGLRWAITLSNAGAYGFEDRCRLEDLADIDWAAVRAGQWSHPDVKHGKQAEFLLERETPWHLVERIGVLSNDIARQALAAMAEAPHRPSVEIRSDWYY